MTETTLQFEKALCPSGWQSHVSVTFNDTGDITAVDYNQKPSQSSTGIAIPAMINLHSHAFQRAMAGMTETRGPDAQDSFWSWRKLMYRFLERLTPEDAESIAAFGQMEMLESGYAIVGEFHYLHHQANGAFYDNRAEMSERMVAAASQSGIGLTLLPVLYEQGGCDGRALSGGQRRFGHTLDEFARLLSDIDALKPHSSGDFSVGVAPHSLRAVSKDSLSGVVTLANGRPVHIHVAEQQAEVNEIKAAYGTRPVQWLLDSAEVNSTWCIVHATHMNADETRAIAQSGATVGLCPITESNLGDGIFRGLEYQQHRGCWGIGTDSNVRISLSEELRTLEYSQRLRDHGRALYSELDRSTGRVLYESALQGGAAALQRRSGSIAVGMKADLTVLDANSTSLFAVDNDGLLDAWIFSSDDHLITNVWSGGRHIVKEGQHIHREHIERHYRKTLRTLSQSL